jgi:hypothetical protein
MYRLVAECIEVENGLYADGVVGKNTYIKLGIDPVVFEGR